HYVSGFEHDDLNMCRLIISQMKQKNNVECISTRTVDEFKSYLNETDMIIASKMHPAVLGVSGYVPVLCIAYDHKQTSFFKRLGMDFCTLEIQKVSFQTLSLMIKSIWTQRDQLKETLKTKIPAWQDDVKRALRRVLAPYAVKMRDESC
ncbi:polysaccharide pyruvyl transferase family protein, partial [Candidatus Bathyarchaeota archaeon]|nr:polysaccharide pyruvyl transferase family protein [Candidatus Bathyarchaeota archaeon]